MYVYSMIVLVHGVPETADLWNKLRPHLQGDSVALSLPGFGCERPAGFAATKDDYANWLVQELSKINEPIDLIGHDWGALLTYRVATNHGELLHSWAAELSNALHPSYVWHDFAQIWQTPGDGEEFFKNQLTQPIEARAAVFEMFGVAKNDATELADKADETMSSCILDLYRSATPNPYATWGAQISKTIAPGMVLIPTEDPFGDETASLEMASMLGATTSKLEGLSHWWMLQDPERAAGTINQFITSVK